MSAIPADIVSLADYEHYAREKMDPKVWAYMAGGAADELTMQENSRAFDRLKLYNRVLVDSRGGHTRMELFGHTYEHPVLLAPIASHKLCHPDGELATVLAASAMKAGMVVSTQSSVDFGVLAGQAQSPLWFQLYMQPDWDFTRSLIKRIERAGYKALVVTVDAPVTGPRNREQRAGFNLPEHAYPVNLKTLKVMPKGKAYAGSSVVFDNPVLEYAPKWLDIEKIKSISPLPVLLKGISHPDDARQAIELGVDGIIVSNHGGRVLDTMPASIEILPGIVKAVQGRVPVLIDGGIRRGTDILKCLALGAHAVLVGRPYIYGLAVGGASGVAHTLHILRTELEMAMVLSGCNTLSDIDHSILFT